MLEPPAFWCGNGRVSTRYGPRVPHARGTAMYPERRQRWLDLAQDYERQADQLEAMEATTQKDQPRFFRSGEWDRVSPGAASSPPEAHAVSATPKRTAPATFGRPGLMSLRSGSMPLAPDRDRCRVVARFPYPQGIRPINADPLDSFEVGKERRESSVRGMHMRSAQQRRHNVVWKPPQALLGHAGFGA